MTAQEARSRPTTEAELAQAIETLAEAMHKANAGLRFLARLPVVAKEEPASLTDAPKTLFSFEMEENQ